MKLNDAFPSKYMKADQLKDKPPIQCTIKSVTIEEIGQDKDEKPVMYFSDHDQGLVLNKSKWALLADAFGDESDDWGGKAVELGHTKVLFGAKMVDSIELKPIMASSQGAFAA